MFAVILTGAPGAGKTFVLTALVDALIDDDVALAAVDADEVAWAYPYPSLDQRCEHLRAWTAAHKKVGHELFLVAEVVESPAHLADVLAAVGTDDHLLVRLHATPATTRERIIAREPPGWSSLAWLLDQTDPLHEALGRLQGVHLALDTEALGSAELVERIRAACPDRLTPNPS